MCFWRTRCDGFSQLARRPILGRVARWRLARESGFPLAAEYAAHPRWLSRGKAEA